MKRIYLLVIACLTLNTALAQTLTETQINKFLDDLQKEQIISEFGKDAFLKATTKDNQTIKQRVASSPLGSFGDVPDSLVKSRAAILGFIGAFELMRSVGSAADDMIQLREMSEKMLGERMFFKPDIEGEINAKNPLTFLGLELNLKPIKANYLTLASRLKAINLIDQKVYDDLLKWLEKDRIKLVKDFGFFFYAAKQTWFYDNYASQKALQLKLIDSLKIIKLLPESKAKSLIASYKPFELKSKVEILALCHNAVIIPNEHGNLTREEIYESLFRQIKNKLIPEFNFTDFKVTELEKSADDGAANGMMGLPFSNPFAKNKKSFKLSYQVNGSLYSQKADTDFALIKTLKKSIPTDINIDSTIIQTYANVFSFLTGITKKDFQSINDFLVDRKSSKRLIIVGNEFNPLLPIRDSRKVAMLVDSAQNTLFKNKLQDNQLFGNMFGSKTDFTDKLSRDNLTKVIEEYQRNEILPSQDKSAIEKAIVDFRFEPKSQQNIKRNLLLNFPSVVAKIELNPKKEEEKITVFKNFISELSRVSRGNFIPEKITDNFDSEIPKGSRKDRNLEMSYRFKDKKYEQKQEVAKIEENIVPVPKGSTSELFTNFDNLSFNEYEWIAMVNSSLDENNVEGQFYKMGSNFGLVFTRNTNNYLFLTQKQFDYLEKNHPEVFTDPAYGDLLGANQLQDADFVAEEFADALKRENMISEDSLKNIDLSSIKEPSALLESSPQALLIDMNELANKSNEELYKYILDKLHEKLLPEVKFSDISYIKVSKESSDDDYQEHLISMKVNDRLYEQSLYVSLAGIIKTGLDSLKKETSVYSPSIGENQFKIVNDYLNDIGSPKRLVIVCDYHSPKLSFVMFDSTQATLVAETLPNNYVDFSMYDRQFSRDSLSEMLYELSRIGLIEKMSELEKEGFILKFRRNPGTGMRFLQTFPRIIIQTNLWDLDNYKQVYKGMMDSLQLISKNQFAPVKLKDNFAKVLKKGNFVDRTFTYSFELNNRKYEEHQFVEAISKPKKKADGSYSTFEFDTTKLIDLVNKSLSEQNIESSYYEIYNDEEEETSGPKFVFLSSKQYRWIRSRFPEIFENNKEYRLHESDRIDNEK